MIPPALRAPLDQIWLDAASKIGIEVVRGGDAYVHWDGVRLHLASDEHLDDDDTVAQLVFHEICHCFVQGPECMGLPDWGLDNRHSDDAVNEAAAVRLQAHLLGGWGLRGALHPTTVVRDFYEELPPNALLPPGDESVRLATLAALRIAQPPVGDIVEEALAATARLLGLPLHDKSGFPLAPAHLACGDCAFRSGGGMCRQSARRLFVRPEARACARFEAALDCLACGACCRSAYDTVPVGPRELVATRHPRLLVRDGSWLALARIGDHCAALAGPAGGPFHCEIYADRPKTCRDFAAGSKHCLDARRRVGLSL